MAPLSPLRTLTVTCLLTAFLAGCLSSTDEDPGVGGDPGAPVSDDLAAGTTIHRAGGKLEHVANITGNASQLLESLPDVVGLARYTGRASFEPTVGIGPDGTLFMTSFTGGDQLIARSFDKGLTWDEVSPKIPRPVDVTGVPSLQFPPNSNDPMIHVDPLTGRVFNIDLQALICSWLVMSDDNGETWVHNPAGCGLPPGVHDHQTIGTAPPRNTQTVGYDNLVYYCVNRVGDSVCASSATGGLTWGPLVPVFPGFDPTRASVDPSSPNNLFNGLFNGLCGGLHGHVATGPDGYVYLPKGQCGVPMVGVSGDDGVNWETYEISRQIGTFQGEHEVRLAVDEAGNVYAIWAGGEDSLPYVAYSTDHGATWSAPVMVAPPGITGTNSQLVAIAAGAPGRIAFAYVATDFPDPHCLDDEEENPPTEDCIVDDIDQRSKAPANWSAYIGIMPDALNPDPLILTVTAHDPADPVARGPCAGRCAGPEGSETNSGIGDFIDIDIDPEGRPWAAFVDVCNDECAKPKKEEDSAPRGNRGFLGTLYTGPKLRGEGVLELLELAPPAPEEAPAGGSR